MVVNSGVRHQHYLASTMSGPRLFDTLPELVREGLLSAEQAERIRVRYAQPQEQSSNRLLLLFSILGGLLIGLGIILVVAHNWADLPRWLRTVLAFLPLVIGQGIVGYALVKRPASAGWKEGGATFLFLAVGSCLALVSQIYNIPGELEGFLLAWSLLAAALLYVSGSLVASLLYLGAITWYAIAARNSSWSNVHFPWCYLPLLAVALPAYVRHWRTHGTSVGFFWHNLFLVISIAFGSQLFWSNDHIEMALGMAGMAVAYCLVPLLHRGRSLRTGAFSFIGCAALLGVLIFTSYIDVWADGLREHALSRGDLIVLLIELGLGIGGYILSLRVRKPFTGGLFPETLGVVLLAYAMAPFSVIGAAVLVNVWLLLVGVQAVRGGLEHDSLSRMNLGLAIISGTIALRFFDLDINDALKGVVFIALGIGFLVMNMRLIAQRKKHAHA